MSRKYEQRGYLDDGAPQERSSQRQGSSASQPEGPRGRGLGAPTATVFRCARCGGKQEPSIPAPEATCGSCGVDLHTCTHCAHFDTASRFECRQELERRIGKKDTRNDCELYALRLAQEFASEPEGARGARAAFDDLFNL